MKLLFFSPNSLEVTEVRKEHKAAGIACEIRGKCRGSHFGEAEVWLQHDRDCHRALLLCVERGVGFARRPTRTSNIESWTDITNGTGVFENESRNTEREPHYVGESVHAPKLKAA